MELEKNTGPYKLKLTPEQEMVLKECDIYPGDLRYISGKRIHDFVLLPDAFYTDDKIVFIDGHGWWGGLKDARKFLYYIGAENEAEVRGYLRGVLVFENVDESRLERRVDENEVEYEERAGPEDDK